MCSAHSQNNWTAAWVGSNEVTLWTMSAREVVQRHSTLRSQSDAQQDLLTALQQAEVSTRDPILACGLSQAAAVEVPAKPAELAPVQLDIAPWHLLALSGLRQKTPLALMQGHTAQIGGFLALNPKWDGVICLPGAVTHWVQVSAAEVVSFQSTLSSGLQAALAQQLSIDDDWSESALKDAVAETMSRPERLAARLAELHANHQLQAAQNPEISGRLWGYLLGAELSAARPYWLGQNLALIGSDHKAAPYLAALSAQGLPVTQADPTRMALEGLIAAWRRLNDTTDAGPPAS
ncbi:2-dehydro-3-deoxygalactonokinase [Pseudophaeobacter sp.]|uniref:2-dehydro-3-deoxygalactonokinase n=1 Tax=Pseudophaeobacter sp. TaxID=1971739 RepID=UPI003A97FD8E